MASSKSVSAPIVLLFSLNLLLFFTLVSSQSAPPPPPPTCSVTIFQHHGRVVDVFIPQKKSARCSKFSFVRFIDISEAMLAVQKLNGAWLFDHHIRVNLARFNARSHYWGRMDSFSSIDQNTCRDQIASNDGACTFLVNANMLGQNMVDNNVSVEFSSPCFEFGPKCRLKSFVQALLNDNNLSNPEDHYLKFIPRKDAPKVIEDQPNRKCCIAKVDVELLHRLEKCCVGIANRCYEADFLLDKFKREGIVNVAIKKITSYHFLLEFEDETTR
ncbi:hypothetical protein REPUB_Repub13aG0165700 [Reevesia pubescens]